MTKIEVSESAIDSLMAMVQKLQSERGMLMYAAQIALVALNESAPINQNSVLPHNFHVKAIKEVFDAITACTDVAKAAE